VAVRIRRIKARRWKAVMQAATLTYRSKTLRDRAAFLLCSPPSGNPMSLVTGCHSAYDSFTINH